MNEELQRKVLELIQSAQDKTPAVVQEYLNWSTIDTWLRTGITASAFIITIMLGLWCVKIAKRAYDNNMRCDKWDYAMPWVFVSILPLGISILPFCLMISNILTLVQIYTAPKVFLLEHLARMVR